MPKITKSHIEKKVDELQRNLVKFLESESADKNLLKANADLLREKEDLANSNEILQKEILKLRRELKTANDSKAKLTERVSELEGELGSYKESLGAIQNLKESLDKLNRLSPPNH